MTDNPVFRRRCSLRSTSNVIKLPHESRYQINLPSVLIKEMNWKINDKLKVDIIKNGLDYTVQIIKEDKF